MQDDPVAIAITYALNHDWDKAVSINKEILKHKENDIESLSRLAYAYLQIGKINEAKRLYHKILTLDQYNIIAQKNLEKIKALPKRYKVPLSATKSPGHTTSLFIEEPGKTKNVTLTNIAPTSVLSKLYVGDTVVFCPKKHSIEVRDQQKTYLGALPDDVAFRLLRLLKAGNCYDICIKSVTKNSISVFIHEIKRGKKFSSQPSFISTATSDRPFIKRSVSDLKEGEELTDVQNQVPSEEE